MKGVTLAVGCLVLGACASSGKSYRHGLMDRFVPVTGRISRAVAEGDQVPRLSGRELASLQADLRHWSWPLRRVKVTSAFGERDGRFHEGIDLEAPVGVPVRAVRSGRVVYADNDMSGYGNLVIVQHSGNLFSLYAHQSRMLVRAGDRVLQDQRIGYTGATGRVSGPHLHFEIRKGVVPVNPSLVLP